MSRSKTNTVIRHAEALRSTCLFVLRSKVVVQTVPDARITGLACRVLELAKQQQPKDELLASIEIEHGNWPVILAAMQVVLQALPGEINQ